MLTQKPHGSKTIDDTVKLHVVRSKISVFILIVIFAADEFLWQMCFTIRQLFLVADFEHARPFVDVR